jgi:hypothetical protein
MRKTNARSMVCYLCCSQASRLYFFGRTRSVWLSHRFLEKLQERLQGVAMYDIIVINASTCLIPVGCSPMAMPELILTIANAALALALQAAGSR